MFPVSKEIKEMIMKEEDAGGGSVMPNEVFIDRDYPATGDNRFSLKGKEHRQAYRRVDSGAAGDKWVIWSVEHDAWWRAGHSGYTQLYSVAGVYSFEEASGICKRANQMQSGDCDMDKSGLARHGQGRPMEVMLPVGCYGREGE